MEGIFLGYVANSPCKRVYNIEHRSVEEWLKVDCSKHSTPPEPTGLTWGFDYDSLFKSFNFPGLSAEDAANFDTEEDTNGEGNDARVDPNTCVGNEAPVDPINIESSSNIQDLGELSTNLETNIQEPTVPETRIHRNYPIDNIIGDPNAGVQTRHRTVTENTSLYAEILNKGISFDSCKEDFQIPERETPIGSVVLQAAVF
ncbi:hypothetical protein L1987_48004 [Smallanthus sonchifolius]|uniref:Uncharacterized protein n=1 Tax=Smallanthus sonchifolius TaxID=185202 RepID=A0ACB9FQE7_9ASTR|nr:hypothetical protein L1987_48004 [Smallanthus sonchifolius]